MEEAVSLSFLSPCFYPTVAQADLMMKSANANKLRGLLYGMETPFIPHGAHAQVLKLYEQMEEKWTDYVLVTDCRDVLFLADETEIIDKFKTFGKDLVMSTEQGCWPPDKEIVDFYYGKDSNGYNYINAGQYIGTWEYVRHCLKHLLDNYRGKQPGADNSQGWWMWAQMRGELDFALDSGCQIFQSMSGGADEHIEVAGKRAFNIWTGSYPCSLHYNGNPSTTNPHGEMYRRLFT